MVMKTGVISKEYQNRGVGRFLLLQSYKYAQEHNLTRVIGALAHCENKSNQMIQHNDSLFTNKYNLFVKLL